MGGRVTRYLPLHLYFKMAQIHNSDLSKEIVQGARLQQNRDIIPNQLAEKVVPVMEVNPTLLKYCNIVSHASSVVTGNMIIYTTPTDKDFYLCGLDAAYNKNVTCDVASGLLTITITPKDGVAVYLNFPIFTLTAEKDGKTINFSRPILMKRGISFTFTGTFTAGNLYRGGTVWGYTIDSPNA